MYDRGMSIELWVGIGRKKGRNDDDGVSRWNDVL